MSASRQQLAEHEQAALGALRRIRDCPHPTGYEAGAPYGAVYGWVAKPAPAGWRPATAERALRRLEERGVLEALPGDRFHSRRWRLREEG